MADGRDPASDQMKQWKEQRAAQVPAVLAQRPVGQELPGSPRAAPALGAVPLPAAAGGLRVWTDGYTGTQGGEGQRSEGDAQRGLRALPSGTGHGCLGPNSARLPAGTEVTA